MSLLKSRVSLLIYKIFLKIKRYRLNKSYNRKILDSFRNKYKGQRCFIIGNGPSLNVEDVEKLKNEFTFAFNRIYYIFDKTSWRPSFYISEDLKILEKSKNEINKLDLPYKFIPDIARFDYNINIENAIYFRQVMDLNNDRTPKFTNEANKWIGWGATVTYTAIQLAIYMGFEEIYLLGIDHNFRVTQNNKGEIIVDNNVKDYFCDEYNKDKEELYIPNVENTTLSYIIARKHCEEKGIKIYNATRGGKLEVFERVDFDKLF